MPTQWPVLGRSPRRSPARPFSRMKIPLCRPWSGIKQVVSASAAGWAAICKSTLTYRKARIGEQGRERDGDEGTRVARTAYHHGSLREALVIGALELVAERGVSGLSVAEAARRAGVSSAAPYRHFASRAALLSAAATTAG